MTSNMYISRFITLLAGLACGAYAAAAAFRNGFAQASTEVDGYIIGVAFAAVVVGSWPLLGLADKARADGLSMKAWGLRLSWLLCLLFIIVNAMGYANHHRTQTVGDRKGQTEAYDRAKKRSQALEEEIGKAKEHKRWDSTNGCTNATVPQSIDYCEEFEEKKALLQKQYGILAEGKPGKADPHAETVAWVVQIDQAVVGKALPIFWSVVLEIMASVLIFASTNSVKHPAKQEAEPAEVKDRSVPKQIESREEESTVEELQPVEQPEEVQRPKKAGKKKKPASSPQMLSWKIDGRRLRGVKNRIANSNEPERK